MGITIVSKVGLVGDITNSDTKIKMGKVDPEWNALVHETKEGVILFLPGVTKKTLKA